MLSAKKIPAGKSGQIEASVKTDGFSGPILKRIAVATNDPRNPSITLSIKATVDPEIAMSDTAIFFENIPVGKEVIREIIMTIPEPKPIKILSAISKDPNIDVRLEAVPGSNGRKIRLIATQKAQAKPGHHYGTIIVKTSSRRTPEITIYERGLVTTTGK